MNSHLQKCLMESAPHTVAQGFEGDTHQKFPVTYFRELDADNGWNIRHIPLKNSSDPWRIVQDLDELNAL